MAKLGARKELLVEAHSANTREMRKIAAETSPRVMAALDARARSPETLIEVGLALSRGQTVKAMDVNEVPEQFVEIDEIADDAHVTSLRRRIRAMADMAMEPSHYGSLPHCAPARAFLR